MAIPPVPTVAEVRGRMREVLENDLAPPEPGEIDSELYGADLVAVGDMYRYERMMAARGYAAVLRVADRVVEPLCLPLAAVRPERMDLEDLFDAQSFQLLREALWRRGFERALMVEQAFDDIERITGDDML